MRAENQRCASVSPASTSASAAMATASQTITPGLLGRMPSSMIAFISSGLATTITAPTTTSARNAAICLVYGRA